MTAEQFATILGQTESDGNPNVKLGDSGQAMGRWQMHPCWVWDQTSDDAAKPTLSDTWDSWGDKLVVRFFNAHTYLPPVECAMYFHLGHRTVVGADDWDANYAARFNHFTAAAGL